MHCTVRCTRRFWLTMANRMNVFMAGSCARSQSEANPWWAVDLGTPMTVNFILFTNLGGFKRFCKWPLYSFASTLCPKKVTRPTLSHYNANIQESILIIYGTNITERVGNRNVVYFLHFCSRPTWQNEKKDSGILLLICCIAALPDFNKLMA